MVAPRAVARFNRHVTNRILGTVTPRLPGFAMVVHQGRKSGRTHRTPVNLFAVDGGYLIAMTYGRESDWVRNILAAGGCTVVVRGREVRLTDPEIVHDPARSQVPAVVRAVLGVVGVDDFLRLRIA